MSYISENSEADSECAHLKALNFPIQKTYQNKTNKLTDQETQTPRNDDELEVLKPK